MMQRVLHISSDNAAVLDLINEKFRVESTVKLAGITAVTVSYDSFFDFNERIYDLILNTFVQKFVFRFLYKNLKYLNIQEQNMIYEELCGEISRDRYISMISVLTASRSILNIEGIFNFTLRPMHEELEVLCSEKANEFALKNEYLDFIRMLRFFADVNYGNSDKLHVVMNGDESAVVLDSNYNRISRFESIDVEFAYLNEMVEHDTLISLLVEASPREIVIHNRKRFDTDDICETIINIFDDRVTFCDGCLLCGE